MNKQLITCKSIYEAQAMAPWATMFQKVANGYLVW